jgi:hypothetical protein
MASLAEANDYIAATDRADIWDELRDEEKERFLNMAALKLRGSYPCLSAFDDEHIYLQASYMAGPDYAASSSGMSGMSASMTGISVSWARSKAMSRVDGLDPILFGLIGDPEVVCPESARAAGRIKVGRLI